VLITYYNERELLKECLESLRAGPEGPDEILVYDDASEAPAREYVPSDFPGRIIRSEVNQGPAHGRNALLKASKSDYIHFQDADDLFHPDWCQRMRKVIEETRADAVFTEVSTYQGDRMVSERMLGLEQLKADGDLVRFSIHNGMLPACGTYRREVVLQMDGYREDIWQSEDYDFHIRLAARGVCYEIIPDSLILQRVRPSGRSQNQVEVWSSAIKAIRMLSEELPPKYLRDLADAAAKAGSILFRIGARKSAREAFRLAYALGRPPFSHARRLYRGVAKIVGVEMAEYASTFYRRFVPLKIRRYLVEKGW